MNIFRSFNLKWWQASLFKISMVAFGVALGATWPEVFAKWISFIWLVFLTTAMYVTYIWWRQIRS
jgi:hypothetical protein